MDMLGQFQVKYQAATSIERDFFDKVTDRIVKANKVSRIEIQNQKVKKELTMVYKQMKTTIVYKGFPDRSVRTYTSYSDK